MLIYGIISLTSNTVLNVIQLYQDDHITDIGSLIVLKAL